MANITFKGVTIHTVGELPSPGETIPDFQLTDGDLTDMTLDDFPGKIKILNIVPSLDTGVCAASARRFNQDAASLPSAVILVISMDLPFAQGRFCEIEGLMRVVPLSAFRSSFGDDYRCKIEDGPMRGLLSRAVIVTDADNTVVYREQVPEIAQEPDYDLVLGTIRNM